MQGDHVRVPCRHLKAQAVGRDGSAVPLCKLWVELNLDLLLPFVMRTGPLPDRWAEVSIHGKRLGDLMGECGAGGRGPVGREH